MIAGNEVVWRVAESPDGTLVGSAAAMRNIGSASDQIAEIFGVAVDPTQRHHGVATSLVRGLVDELAAANFILCEARTADAGGWKVARNVGFRPIGYEPYAHSMPVGFESMVLTGLWPRAPHEQHGDTPPTPETRGLRAAVMGWTLPMDVRLEDQPQIQATDLIASDPGVSVRRDDVAGRHWFEQTADLFNRSSGIIGLKPLQGIDYRNGRFMQACYVASSASSELGAARVVYDRVDARARVLGLRATVPAVRAALLRCLVDDLLRLAGHSRLVIIVLVDSKCDQAHGELGRLGFFPTVYLPGFVAAPLGRSDVVQYTRLAGCSLRDSSRDVTAKEWPDAERVIAQVLRFAP
jgi:acetyltransferase (GNAT) family protein